MKCTSSKLYEASNTANVIADIVKMMNLNMNTIKVILLLAVISTSFIPAPEINPVRHHDVVVEFRFVLNEKVTVFYDYQIQPDTVINLTGQIPDHRQLYLIIKTKP